MSSERERQIEGTRPPAAGPEAAGADWQLSGSAPALLGQARAWAAIAEGSLEGCASERELDLELRRRRQQGGQ